MLVSEVSNGLHQEEWAMVELNESLRDEYSLVL